MRSRFLLCVLKAQQSQLSEIVRSGMAMYYGGWKRHSVGEHVRPSSHQLASWGLLGTL